MLLLSRAIEPHSHGSIVTIPNIRWNKTQSIVVENPRLRGSTPRDAWLEARWCESGNPEVSFKNHPVTGFAIGSTSSILLCIYW